MRVDWNCTEQLGEIQTVQLTVSTTGKAGLVEGDGARLVVGSRNRVHELFRMSTWMVEAAFPANDKLLITLVPRQTSPSRLELAFEGDTVSEVSFDVRSAAGQQQKTLTGVTSVVFDGGVLSVECAGDPSQRQNNPGPEPDINLESELAAALTAEREAHAAEQRAREAAERERDANASIITQLQSTLAEERQRTSALRGVAASNLDTALANARVTRDALSQDLRDRLASIDGVQHEIEDLTTQIGDARTRITELEQQRAELAAERERLEPIEEAHSLDCEQASAELEELRLRFGANNGTAELLQKDEFLSGNSVRKTLAKVTKELESIERRIGLIITYRESFLGEVQQSMVNGDGTLPLNRDLERGYDGDSGEPEAPDQEA